MSVCRWFAFVAPIPCEAHERLARAFSLLSAFWFEFHLVVLVFIARWILCVCCVVCSRCAVLVFEANRQAVLAGVQLPNPALAAPGLHPHPQAAVQPQPMAIDVKDAKVPVEVKADDAARFFAELFKSFSAGQSASVPFPGAAPPPSAFGFAHAPPPPPASSPAAPSPAQALFQARQLTSAQGSVPHLAFSMIPEAFLPQPLPPSLATLVLENKFVDFEAAFKLLSAADGTTPVDSKDKDSKGETDASPKAGKYIRFLRDWLYVYAAIMAFVADHKPAQLRDYVGYLKGFNALAARSGFIQAYDYDQRNRSYCARAGNPLAVYKPDLWLPAASSGSSADPQRNNKRRAPSSSTADDKPRQKRRSDVRYHDGKQVCFLYNKGRCKEPCSGSRAHVCLRCAKQHPESQCTAGSAAASSASASKGNA